MKTVRGRLAPSPTGYLHLGNAWTFMLAWLAARAEGGEVLLRIEDIDPQRSRPEYISALMDDIRWLGLDWDYGPGVNKRQCDADNQSGLDYYLQSNRTSLYDRALAFLSQSGLTYPCFCSRRELRYLAAAPHMDDIGAPYPGTCRNLSREQLKSFLAQGRKPSLRLRCPEELICFSDVVQGYQCLTLADCGGDFVLQRSDGVIAYQLAVAVDDALMGITQVVRGRDILPSTPRQILLLHLLEGRVPQYAHVPLLLDASGQRLAKRHASLALRNLRTAGASSSDIIGLFAHLAGISVQGLATPSKLLRSFALSRLPQGDIRLTDDLLRAHGLAA